MNTEEHRPIHAVVTGGAGFIGSHVVDALLARGDTVTVLDDLSTGSVVNLHSARRLGARLHVVDVRDARAVAELIATERPALVIHLAARIDVRASVDDPIGDAVVNVLGTLAVLEASHRVGVRRVVLASTGGAIYGDSEVLPTPENAPALPMSGYGQGKLSAEGYLQLFHRLHGLSGMALRFANVYGPRQRADGEGGVIAVVSRLVRRGEAATIFGDGHQTRDYVHVRDVAEAVLAAADSSSTDPINIGTGRETTVRALVDLLRDFEDDTPPPRFEPARPGEVLRSCLDVRRADQVLGWHARTPLPEGLWLTYAALGTPTLPAHRSSAEPARASTAGTARP